MEKVDLSPLLAHLDAEIAELVERLASLRRLRADLLRAAEAPRPTIGEAEG